MKFEKRPKPSAETMEGPWKCAAGTTVTDGDDTYGPGDTVPDSVVKKNGWLVSAGRVTGKPKKPKAKAKK